MIFKRTCIDHGCRTVFATKATNKVRCDACQEERNRESIRRANRLYQRRRRNSIENKSDLNGDPNFGAIIYF